ncbi:MAG: hypothetical protein Q9N32_06090 [Gammaproteobacteria bacterium]|nr:hypothetical protein [Gammaproteobacteria bacterium]
MAQFAYTALTSSGNELSGKQQADTLNAAAQELRERGLRVLEIKPAKQSSFLGQENMADWFASQRSAFSSALVFFFSANGFYVACWFANDTSVRAI